MVKRNVIIRKISAVETLGSTTVICTDKTGTLTLNEMTVTSLWIDGQFITVTGGGYAPEGDFVMDNKIIYPDNNNHLSLTLTIAALCNDAILNRTGTSWEILGDPTEGALLTVAGKAGLFKHQLEKKYPRLDEIPFESEKQYMVTMHAEGEKNVIFVKGSPEKVLSMCSRIYTEQGLVEMNDAFCSHIIDANEQMASGALRVLAVATAPFEIESGNIAHPVISGNCTFIGLIGMIDPPRDEVRHAILSCKKAGIRVAMVTGDNALTATAIAIQLGICKPGERTVAGKEIEISNNEQLMKICRRSTVFARIEPLHKLRIVNAFKQDGYITAMTGDGVNDAPALESAHIGVSMGITGTDVAKEASDMVIADDNFASIVAAVEEGRIVFNRLRNVVFFLLMTCISELFLLILSVTFYGESPLEPVQILWINLVTGSLAAIPLGFEPGSGKELLQPPRDINVGLLYRGMIFRMTAVAFTIGILITWVFHHAPIPVGTDPSSTLAIRQTIAFTSIVVFEWLFVFQARSPEENIHRIGIFRNRWLLLSMCLGFILQGIVIYLPVANRLFLTHPLTILEILWALLPGVAVFFMESIRKAVTPRLFNAGQLR